MPLNLNFGGPSATKAAGYMGLAAGQAAYEERSQKIKFDQTQQSLRTAISGFATIAQPHVDSAIRMNELKQRNEETLRFAKEKRAWDQDPDNMRAQVRSRIEKHEMIRKAFSTYGSNTQSMLKAKGPVDKTTVNVPGWGDVELGGGSGELTAEQIRRSMTAAVGTKAHELFNQGMARPTPAEGFQRNLHKVGDERYWVDPNNQKPPMLIPDPKRQRIVKYNEGVAAERSRLGAERLRSLSQIGNYYNAAAEEGTLDFNPEDAHKRHPNQPKDGRETFKQRWLREELDMQLMILDKTQPLPEYKKFGDEEPAPQPAPQPFPDQPTRRTIPEPVPDTNFRPVSGGGPAPIDPLSGPPPSPTPLPESYRGLSTPTGLSIEDYNKQLARENAVKKEELGGVYDDFLDEKWDEQIASFAKERFFIPFRTSDDYSGGFGSPRPGGSPVAKKSDLERSLQIIREVTKYEKDLLHNNGLSLLDAGEDPRHLERLRDDAITYLSGVQTQIKLSKLGKTFKGTDLFEIWNDKPIPMPELLAEEIGWGFTETHPPRSRRVKSKPPSSRRMKSK